MARAIAAAVAHPFGMGNAQYRLGTSRVRDVDTLQCGCYRRDVFERLGPFDEDLLRSQDSELTFRVLRAGGRVSSESRSEEHTSELQSHSDLVCRLLLEKKKKDN